MTKNLQYKLRKNYNESYEKLKMKVRKNLR